MIPRKYKQETRKGFLEKKTTNVPHPPPPPNPTRVVILVRNMPSRPVLHLYQASSKYSIGYSFYRAETRNQIQTQEGEITPKVKKVEVVILVCDMSSGPVLYYYQVSSKYSKECSTYIADTKSMHNQHQI